MKGYLRRHSVRQLWLKPLTLQGDPPPSYPNASSPARSTLEKNPGPLPVPVLFPHAMPLTLDSLIIAAVFSGTMIKGGNEPRLDQTGRALLYRLYKSGVITPPP